MIIETSTGVPMDARMFNNYMRSLVNRFFKILPIKENGEEYGEGSLEAYMKSLQAELLGYNELIFVIHDDPLLVSLLNILQYLIDNPECSLTIVRREVFRAISICNKLKAKYTDESAVIK